MRSGCSTLVKSSCRETSPVGKNRGEHRALSLRRVRRARRSLRVGARRQPCFREVRGLDLVRPLGDKGTRRASTVSGPAFVAGWERGRHRIDRDLRCCRLRARRSCDDRSFPSRLQSLRARRPVIAGLVVRETPESNRTHRRCRIGAAAPTSGDLKRPDGTPGWTPLRRSPRPSTGATTGACGAGDECRLKSQVTSGQRPGGCAFI
jgi:hypothetical protein